MLKHVYGVIVRLLKGWIVIYVSGCVLLFKGASRCFKVRKCVMVFKAALNCVFVF